MSNPPYKALDIAKWLINKGIDEAKEIDQLKLQKLLYFAQGYFWRIHQDRLIEERFLVWKYGPVVKTVRDEYRGYGASIIDDEQEIYVEIDSKTKSYLSQFWDNFAIKYNANQLVGMTHAENSPWVIAWNEKRKYIPSGSIRRAFATES